MKTLYLLLVLFFLVVESSFGQITSFTGKIVDEHNDPVAGSHIRIFKHGTGADLIADNEGLFTISHIAVGEYYADINANGRIVRNKRIFIQPEGRVKVYYNFKLYAQGVTVSIMAQSRPQTAYLSHP